MDSKEHSTQRNTLDTDAHSSDLSFLEEIDGLLDSVFMEGDSPDTPILPYEEDDHGYNAELQSIFRLAVKDHLRPVVTYVSYILNGQGSYEAIDGLVSILPSIVEAAREVDMLDFADVLERMYALVLPMQDQPEGFHDDETFRELALNLSCIPAMLEMREGDSLHRAMSIDSEFEALSQTLHKVQTLNSETIHALFRAGLTTTKALLTNRKSEIADVTGIEPELVDNIIDAVKESPLGRKIISQMRERQKVMTGQRLDEIETKLGRALNIREKIVAKLQRQRRLMEQIQRENTKLEAYFVSLSEKLKTFTLEDQELSMGEQPSPELQQLRLRVRSIRHQIEQLAQNNTQQTDRRNILMGKIARLQKRYKSFMAAEERMISDLQIDKKDLHSLRESIKQVRNDLKISENRHQ